MLPSMSWREERDRHVHRVAISHKSFAIVFGLTGAMSEHRSRLARSGHLATCLLPFSACRIRASHLPKQASSCGSSKAPRA